MFGKKTSQSVKNLDEARTILAENFPFYASLLAQCDVSFVGPNVVPTIGVALTDDGGAVLAINPDFFDKQASPFHRAGLLMHEMQHLGLKHLTRAKNYADHMVANMAEDLEINQYIPPDWLPPGGLLPKQFGLPENRGFEFYYTELMRKKVKAQATLDDHGGFAGAGKDGKKGKGGGKPGNKSGKDQPGDQGDGNGEENDDAGKSGIGECQLSEEMQNAMIDSMIAAAGRKAGSMPQHIEKLLEDTIRQRSRVNWKSVLRAFIGRQYSAERESSRNRPNRRMGFKAPGSVRKDAAKILVAIDSSGSVNDRMLKAALGEVSWILDVIKDNTEIAFFDTRIAHTEKLSKLDLKSNKRYCSGGTDFNCIVEHALKTRPDLTIILTDGEASNPRHSGDIRLLWGIIGNYGDDHLEGTKVRIPIE